MSDAPCKVWCLCFPGSGLVVVSVMLIHFSVIPGLMWPHWPLQQGNRVPHLGSLFLLLLEKQSDSLCLMTLHKCLVLGLLLLQLTLGTFLGKLMVVYFLTFLLQWFIVPGWI